jgi:hypothetical protein
MKKVPTKKYSVKKTAKAPIRSAVAARSKTSGSGLTAGGGGKVVAR